MRLSSGDWWIPQLVRPIRIGFVRGDAEMGVFSTIDNLGAADWLSGCYLLTAWSRR